MIFEIYEGMDANAKRVPLDQAPIILGTLGECGLGYPVERERLPIDIQKGDKFLWSETGILERVT